MTALDIARRIVERGWAAFPVPYRSKIPELKGWQQITGAEGLAHFNGAPMNIGVNLGAPSGGLTDVDLDVREALDLADIFLPRTACEFGRAGKPRSHREYIVSPLPETTKFQDISKVADTDVTAMIVELRSTGAQTVFPGSVHESGEPITFSSNGEPACVDGDDLLRRVRSLAIAAMLVRHWPAKGSRHETVLAAAGVLLRAQIDVADVALILTSVARYADRDADLGIVKSDVASTAVKLRDGDETTGGPRLADLLRNEGAAVVRRLTKWLGGTGSMRFPRTEAGCAERFIERFGDRVRYCAQWKSWLVWNDTHWTVDDDGVQVMGLARESARANWAERTTAKDDKERKEITGWLVRSESEPALRHMLRIARSDVAVAPSKLDSHPFLLNTPSGTLELRTGHLRPHRAEDLITKITATPYTADARHPVFDAFLDKMVPDAEIRGYVQRVAGYCLSGDISEEKLFFGHGPTAGGKSTLLKALRKMMGDYAAVADFATFCEKKYDGPKEDIARLAGKRLVISVEVKDGTKLAEGLVKWITGGDDIAARRLYEGTFEFAPQFKLLLAANFRPKAGADDEAFWRRVCEIPFPVSLAVAERDPSVKTTLCDPSQAGAAILAWAVDGAAQWFEQGLKEPKAIKTATEAYREDMDPLKDFFTDVCVFDVDAVISAGDIRAAYEAWAKANSIREPLGVRAFAERLKARKCVDRRKNGVRQWVGLRVRTPSDPDPEPQRDVNDAVDASSETSPYTHTHEGSYGSNVNRVNDVTAGF